MRPTFGDEAPGSHSLVPIGTWVRRWDKCSHVADGNYQRWTWTQSINQSISPWGLKRSGGGFIHFEFPRCGPLFNSVSFFVYTMSLPTADIPLQSERWPVSFVWRQHGLEVPLCCRLSTTAGEPTCLQSVWPFLCIGILPLLKFLKCARWRHPNLPRFFVISHVVGRFVVHITQSDRAMTRLRGHYHTPTPVAGPPTVHSVY